VFADRKEKVMKDGLDAHLLPEERLPAPKAPLPAPERLPALEKTTLEEVPAETSEPLDSKVSETVDRVFNSDDVWSARHQ
jgi:hypothetical protein